MLSSKTVVRQAARVARIASKAASSSTSSSVEPALAPGVNPAYDAALTYLSSQTASLLERSRAVRSSNSDEADRLEVQALINDPATRRSFAENRGKGQMDQPVMRYLAGQAWRKEGGLDVLMQRIHQMGVVPDVVPTVSSSRGKSNVQPLMLRIGGNEVEPGLILSPSDLATPPEINVQLLQHPAAGTEGTFTLFIIDADAPHPETHSYAQRLVAWKSGIPLSVTSAEINLLSSDVGTERLPYLAPTPEKGTGKHRYVILLLPDPSASREIPSPPEGDRSFNFRAYLDVAGQTAADITSISMLRSAWQAESHAEGAVEYGKPPKEARFGYPLSAQQRRQEIVRQMAYEQAMQELGSELGVEVVEEDKQL